MTKNREQRNIKEEALVEHELSLEVPKIIEFRGKDLNELQIATLIRSARDQTNTPFEKALRNSLDYQTRVGKEGIQGFQSCIVQIEFIQEATEWMLNEYLKSVISHPNSYEYRLLASKVELERKEKNSKIPDFDRLINNQDDFNTKRDLLAVFIRYFYQYVDPSIRTTVPRTIRNLVDFLGKQVQFQYFGRYLINQLLNYDDCRLLKAQPDLHSLMSEDQNQGLVMKKKGRNKFLYSLYFSPNQEEQNKNNSLDLDVFFRSLLYSNQNSSSNDFAVEILGLAESIPILSLTEWYNGLHFDQYGKPHTSNKTIHTARNPQAGRLVIIPVYQSRFFAEGLSEMYESKEQEELEPETELSASQIPETSPITKTISDPVILGETFMSPIIFPKQKYARIVIRSHWNKLYEVIFKAGTGLTIELVGEFKDGRNYAKSDGRGAIKPETEEHNKFFYWSGASETISTFNKILKNKNIDFTKEWLSQFTPTYEVKKQVDGTFEIFWSVDPFYYVEVLASFSTCIRIFSDKNGELFAQERPDLEPYKIVGSNSWIEKDYRGLYSHFKREIKD